MKKIIEKLQKSAPDKLEAFKAAAKVAVKKVSLYVLPVENKLNSFIICHSLLAKPVSAWGWCVPSKKGIYSGSS